MWDQIMNLGRLKRFTVSVKDMKVKSVDLLKSTEVTKHIQKGQYEKHLIITKGTHMFDPFNYGEPVLRVLILFILEEKKSFQNALTF